MNTKNELIEWLRDAYAMEKAMEMTLKKQMERDDILEPLRDQFETHHAETQLHAELVESCLRQVGANISTLKTTLAEAVEMLKNAGASFARDAHVKEVLAAYSAEHFEIGCYTALIAGAQRLGFTDVASVCEDILADEKRMADWLEANLPQAVTSYLQEPASDDASAPPSPPRQRVEDIDTPVEAGSDDDPAEALANRDWEEVPGYEQRQPDRGGVLVAER
jgi:ferritin-like metal-binding protein YciE